MCYSPVPNLNVVTELRSKLTKRLHQKKLNKTAFKKLKSELKKYKNTIRTTRKESDDCEEIFNVKLFHHKIKKPIICPKKIDTVRIREGISPTLSNIDSRRPLLNRSVSPRKRKSLSKRKRNRTFKGIITLNKFEDFEESHRKISDEDSSPSKQSALLSMLLSRPQSPTIIWHH